MLLLLMELALFTDFVFLIGANSAEGESPGNVALVDFSFERW